MGNPAAMNSVDYSIFHEIVIESIATGIVTINLEGKILTINKAAEEIFGISRDEAIGNSFLNGLAADERERLGKTIDYVIRTGRVFCGNEISTVNRQGKKIHINTYVSLFKTDTGQEMGVVMLTEDITEKKKLEDEIRRADKLTALGELALGVAHEFRNPLGSIRGLTSLVKSDLGENSKQAQYLELVIKEVDRLERVSRELLDFARNQYFESKPVDMNEIIKQVLFLCELSASLYNINIKKHLDKHLVPVYGDEEKLRQAFLNLIRNALQAIGEQGEIVIESFREGDWVIIKVRDSGAGIPNDVLHKIFDPFYTTRERGSGLGLSVVHQVITGHGGHVAVDSELNVGTTFTVKLPIERGLRILGRKTSNINSRR